MILDFAMGLRRDHKLEELRLQLFKALNCVVVGAQPVH